LISKVENQALILEMSDALGDMMYAESETLMWERWYQFQIKYAKEEKFLNYFREEWMNRIGIVFMRLCLCLTSYFLFIFFYSLLLFILGNARMLTFVLASCREMAAKSQEFYSCKSKHKWRYRGLASNFEEDDGQIDRWFEGSSIGQTTRTVVW
jgi:hypothetical protein